MKKVIEATRVWTCQNMDFLAPIDKQGYLVLFSDNSTEIFWDNDRCEQYFSWATNEEKEIFRKMKGYLLAGDEVEIVKGRKLPIGSIKTIKGFMTYIVPNTYGHKSTLYCLFTDGTKTAIENVKPTCELFDDAFIRPFDGYFLKGGRI